MKTGLTRAKISHNCATFIQEILEAGGIFSRLDHQHKLTGAVIPEEIALLAEKLSFLEKLYHPRFFKAINQDLDLAKFKIEMISKSKYGSKVFKRFCKKHAGELSTS